MAAKKKPGCSPARTASGLYLFLEKISGELVE
jgi:hypothetical protein